MKQTVNIVEVTWTCDACGKTLKSRTEANPPGSFRISDGPIPMVELGAWISGRPASKSARMERKASFHIQVCEGDCLAEGLELLGSELGKRLRRDKAGNLLAEEDS